MLNEKLVALPDHALIPCCCDDCGAEEDDPKTSSATRCKLVGRFPAFCEPAERDARPFD